MMTDRPSSVLERMMHRQTPAVPDVPLTASRAVRLAATRAAQNSIGLTLTVLGVSEDMLELDSLLAEFSDDLLIVGLMAGGAVRGLILCDQGLCAAGVEMQTLGRVARRAPDPRRVTRADGALIAPYLDRLLIELRDTTPRTVLDGWADGVVAGDPIESPRAAGFVLSDHHYRLIRLSLDLGGEDRQGQLMIALPMQSSTPLPKVQAVEPVANWADDFRAAVLAAPATLQAVLHRFNMPLSVATALTPGQLVPLKGCTVGAVRLMDPDGRMVARGRLGQVAGQIAVRIENPGLPQLDEMPDMARHGDDAFEGQSQLMSDGVIDG